MRYKKIKLTVSGIKEKQLARKIYELTRDGSVKIILGKMFVIREDNHFRTGTIYNAPLPRCFSNPVTLVRFVKSVHRDNRII